MLTTEEIKRFIDEDKGSRLKKQAAEGQKYYEGKHDILEYRMFYYDDDGNLKEDQFRSNRKIPHPFFTELVDQATQHIMSGSDDMFKSDNPELQKQLDLYFNTNEDFMAELAETITGQQAKGFDYMYAYIGEDDRLKFENADCLGVVEVEGRFTESGKDHRIWKYVDRIDKDKKIQFKILVIDDQCTQYFKQTDDGAVELDKSVKINPKPHRFYKKEGSEELYVKENNFLPFFMLPYNKKRTSHLKPIKPLIDDYDLMSSSLTNNLVDFDHPLHVVKGFEGDDLGKLTMNLNTAKRIGVGEGGDVDIKTVAIPYDARKVKMELDEKNIYRFGMGLNMSGLKDTAATTNIAIKAAYSLLELRCSKIKTELKRFLRQILKVVLEEINEKEGTDYQPSMVYFNFEAEIMANETENAQNKLVEAQEQQTRINTLLTLATQLDNETLMQLICEVLDIDYEEIKSKLPDPDEADNNIDDALGALGGGVIE